MLPSAVRKQSEVLAAAAATNQDQTAEADEGNRAGAGDDLQRTAGSAILERVAEEVVLAEDQLNKRTNIGGRGDEG